MAKILVIDDEEMVRNVIKRILERNGYEVVVALNGRDGAEMYRESPADAIICDILMPEKDGLEVLIELKRDFPEVKIIVISGGGTHGMLDYLQAAKKLGAVDALAKPFRNQDLLSAVEKALAAAGRDEKG